MNWCKNLKYLVFGLLVPFFSMAQETVRINPLAAPELNLKADKFFFVSDVIDARTQKGNTLGQVIHLTKRVPLALSRNLENEAFSYWNGSFKRKSPDMLPVVVKIRTLSFSETRVAPGKIKGESQVGIDFFWYRGLELVRLTTYNAKSEYTRPEGNFVHENFLSKMLTGSIEFLDKWMQANKGKNPALVRGVRLVVQHENLPPKADTVFYHPERALTYSDFKAAPRPGRYAAMVFTSISYEGDSKVIGDYLEVTIKLKVYLVKSMSWMRSESRNPKVLKHEQTHFDIAKIAADRFGKKIKALPLTLDDHDSQIQYQFLESYREMHELQKSYDRDTQHGLNSEAQLRWEEMVKNELLGLKEIPSQ